MGLRENIRVDPQRDLGPFAKFRGAFGEQLQLTLTLYIKKENSGAQGQIHLRSRFADTGEDDPLAGRTVSGQYTLQFTAGNNIEARAPARQHLKNCQS